MRCALALVLLTACTVGVANPFETEGAVIQLETRDAGLKDGEMPAIVAQEWCWRWICEGHRGEVRQVSCGGLTEYDCR